MALVTVGETVIGTQFEWTDEDEETRELYFDCYVPLRKYTVPESIAGPITFYAYRNYNRYDSEDGYPVIYSDKSGKPDQKLTVDEPLIALKIRNGEGNSWAHVEVPLRRNLKEGEKIWIGIHTMFFSGTWKRTSETKSFYYYEWEGYPAPETVENGCLNDWYPNAKLNFYFTGEAVIPPEYYTRTMTDTLRIKGTVSRLAFRYKKLLNAGISLMSRKKEKHLSGRKIQNEVTATEDGLRRLVLLHRQVLGSFLLSAVHAMKGTYVRIAEEAASLSSDTWFTKLLLRMVGSVLSCFDGVRKRMVLNRIELYFYSPITLEIEETAEI